jgi:hypothetical protein
MVEWQRWVDAVKKGLVIGGHGMILCCAITRLRRHLLAVSSLPEYPPEGSARQNSPGIEHRLAGISTADIAGRLM